MAFVDDRPRLVEKSSPLVLSEAAKDLRILLGILDASSQFSVCEGSEGFANQVKKELLNLGSFREANRGLSACVVMLRAECAEMIAALSSVPQLYADAVRMCYLESIENAEIAVVMNTSVETVCSLVSRGLKDLREKLRAAK